MSSGWEKLTDKQKTGLEKEIRELFEWERAQREQLMRTLKDEGKWIGGLDGNQKDFALIISERKRRFREIQEKYGLR